jgi:hypothetical protein
MRFSNRRIFVVHACHVNWHPSHRLLDGSRKVAVPSVAPDRSEGWGGQRDSNRSFSSELSRVRDVELSDY